MLDLKGTNFLEMEKEMEDDLTVLHYQFFLFRGHMFRGGNYGAGVGDRRKRDGLFHCLTEPAFVGEIAVKISKI